jgi:hypothetical protein
MLPGDKRDTGHLVGMRSWLAGASGCPKYMITHGRD